MEEDHICPNCGSNRSRELEVACPSCGARRWPVVGYAYAHEFWAIFSVAVALFLIASLVLFYVSAPLLSLLLSR